MATRSEAAADKPATAIDRYRQAWDAATEALRAQAKKPELKKDNDKDGKGDKGEKGNGKDK